MQWPKGSNIFQKCTMYLVLLVGTAEGKHAVLILGLFEIGTVPLKVITATSFFRLTALNSGCAYIL